MPERVSFSIISDGDDVHRLYEPRRRISDQRRYIQWHQPEFPAEMVERMRCRAERAGAAFGTGTRAIAWLAEVNA